MKNVIIFLLIAGCSNFIYGQSDVVVISLEDDISVPDSNFIQEISIKRKFFKKSYSKLIAQAVDSASTYEGNCLKITYHDKSESTSIKQKEYPDYLRANIYNIDNTLKTEIEGVIEDNQIESDSLLRSRKTSKDFEISLGMQYASFHLENNEGFNIDEKGGLEGYFNFFFDFNRVFKFKNDPKLNFRIGIGAARENLIFSPLVTLEEAGISNTDSIRVAEVENWEYQLLFPISISYEFPNLIKSGFGIRIILGVENRYRMFRARTENVLIANYSLGDDSGVVYENEQLSNKTNDHFSGFITPYSMQVNIGIGLLNHELGSGGIRFTNLLIPSFGEGQKIKEQFGLMVYIDIPLFDHK